MGNCQSTDFCNLPEDELQERIKMIRSELLPLATGKDERANGCTWTFERNPELQRKLEELVEFERQCCSGLDWDLSEGPSTLSLSVDGVAPSRIKSALKAGGLGLGLSVFLFCVLPLGLAAFGGAAIAGHLARFDHPVALSMAAMLLALPIGYFLRRRF